MPDARPQLPPGLPTPTWADEAFGVALYRGDCLEILPQLPDGCVDAVVTDPPYGIAHASHGQIFKSASRIAGDESLALAETLRGWAKGRAICCCMFFSPYRPLGGWRNVLCWVKGEHVGIGGDRATCWKRDFELIGVEANGSLTGSRHSAVLRFNALSPPPTGHVAEKPVKLLAYLLWKLGPRYPFDPCMGSGTTGVAAVNLGRAFIGIEIDRGYFDIAVDRIRKAITEAQGGPMFADHKPTKQNLFSEGTDSV